MTVTDFQPGPDSFLPGFFFVLRRATDGPVKYSERR